MCWFSQVCTQFPFFSRPSLLSSTDFPSIQTTDFFFSSGQPFPWGTHPLSGFVIIFVHCYGLHFHASAPFMFMSITNLLSITFHKNSRAGSMFLNICYDLVFNLILSLPSQDLHSYQLTQWALELYSPIFRKR